MQYRFSVTTLGSVFVLSIALTILLMICQVVMTQAIKATHFSLQALKAKYCKASIDDYSITESVDPGKFFFLEFVSE